MGANPESPLRSALRQKKLGELAFSTRHETTHENHHLGNTRCLTSHMSPT